MLSYLLRLSPTAPDGAEKKSVDDEHRTSRIAFASGMIALGILGLVRGDFALQWQPVPATAPFRTPLAYLAAVIMLGGGFGLLFRSTTRIASRILFPYLLIWVLLKIPVLSAAPTREATWSGLGEIIALMTGGWILFARYAAIAPESPLGFAIGKQGIRMAQLAFGAGIVPLGISHIMYVPQTLVLVPQWLPYRTAWVYITGVGQTVAGLGILFSVLPRVAAASEASMITIFTILVWIPLVISGPSVQINWVALCISWAIAAAGWVVAGSFDP